MGHYFINDENLKSDIQEFKVKIDNQEFIFKTDNGVFSKGELDYGTYLLIDTVLKENIHGDVLDLGCGYGPIGIILQKKIGVNVTMVDINKRALHLAKKNIIENECSNIEVVLSDGFMNLKQKYNYIITNPPIRVGKVKLYSLLNEAKNYLLPDGLIYLVIRKEQGAKSFIKDFSKNYEINVLNKSKGFYIISLKSC